MPKGYIIGHITVNEPFVVWTFATGIVGTVLCGIGYAKHDHLRTPPPDSLSRHDPKLLEAGSVSEPIRSIRRGVSIERGTYGPKGRELDVGHLPVSDEPNYPDAPVNLRHFPIQ